MEWFGLGGDIKGDAVKVLNGEKTLEEQLKSMIKQPVNKVASGISPVYKTPAELAFGKKSYPDVTKPSTIKDKPKYIADTLGVGNEFSKLTGRPTRPYKNSIKDFVMYSSDPQESSYWNILDVKRRFEEKTKGKGASSSSLSEKSLALYNYKLALRYKDDEAAQKYFKKYNDLGGSNKGLKISFDMMNPLYGLKGKEKTEFLNSLNERDKKRLELAVQYYDELKALNKEQKSIAKKK
jgi:hypothetical protein